LLNIFGGPAVNAARGIASQVINATTVLVNGFQNAVNPQLVKSYASDDKQQTCSLLCRSSKFSYYLMYIIALPVLFECDFLLDLWLVDVPAYAVLFTRIVLLDCLIGTLSGPMITALMATGNIKWYQTTREKRTAKAGTPPSHKSNKKSHSNNTGNAMIYIR